MKNFTSITKIYSGTHVIGFVEDDVFHKAVSASRHFLRCPRAIAFDVQSLDDAERAGARAVEVLDRESGQIYRSPISSIREHGIPINRGFGDQIALLLDDWKRTDQPHQAAFWS